MIMPEKWKSESVKYVGIKIYRPKEAMMRVNIVPLINYIQEKCQLWSSYHLSWLGKIEMVLIAKLIFVF